MSFFNFDPSIPRWTLSGKIWIYFAFAVPLTIMTVGLWVLWQLAQRRALQVAKKGEDRTGWWIEMRKSTTS